MHIGDDERGFLPLGDVDQRRQHRPTLDEQRIDALLEAGEVEFRERIGDQPVEEQAGGRDDDRDEAGIQEPPDETVVREHADVVLERRATNIGDGITASPFPYKVAFFRKNYDGWLGSLLRQSTRDQCRIFSFDGIYRRY